MCREYSVVSSLNNASQEPGPVLNPKKLDQVHFVIGSYILICMSLHAQSHKLFTIENCYSTWRCVLSYILYHESISTVKHLMYMIMFNLECGLHCGSLELTVSMAAVAVTRKWVVSM